MIVLTGQTPSHKNSKQMFVNRKSGRSFPANNKNYLAWKSGAIYEAKYESEKKNIESCALVMTFFVKDKRHRDLDNMIASVQDVLVEAGVLSDDNVFNLPMIFANFGGIDRENPRAAISICETSREFYAEILKISEKMHE